VYNKNNEQIDLSQFLLSPLLDRLALYSLPGVSSADDNSAACTAKRVNYRTGHCLVLLLLVVGARLLADLHEFCTQVHNDLLHLRLLLSARG